MLEFGKKHPDSEEPLNRWYHILKKSNYNSLAELKKHFQKQIKLESLLYLILEEINIV